MEALKEPNHQLLCDILNEEGLDVNKEYPEEKNSTLLHAAAERGNVTAVGMLLSSGADAGKTNRLTGQTALHAACGKRARDGAFRALLAAKGTDVNARAAGGKTVLHYLVKRCEKEGDGYDNMSLSNCSNNVLHIPIAKQFS